MKNKYEIILDKIANNLMGFTIRFRERERYYPMYLMGKPFTNKIYMVEEFISEKVSEFIEE